MPRLPDEAQTEHLDGEKGGISDFEHGITGVRQTDLNNFQCSRIFMLDHVKGLQRKKSI